MESNVAVFVRRVRCALVCACLLAAGVTNAEVTVTNVVVCQRWPWSEKVDVDFLLTGGTSEVKIEAVWDGQPAPYELGTLSEAKSGWNRFTWDPSLSPFADKTLAGFSVTVTPVTAPSNRYLIIDLVDGGVSYAACPDGTDGRWSDTYKTTKMVFRRIPAGTYQLGMESNRIAHVNGGPIDSLTATAWKRHNVTFSSDYYVGVYKMTTAQYNVLKGNSAGTNMKPKTISYDELRGSVTNGVNWPATGYNVVSTSLVAAVRAKAGSDLRIDLCQECQWEAAMRAGKTTFWPNGGTLNDSPETLTNIVETIAWRGGDHDVGIKADNGWGIYDSVGISPEWTLDTITGGKTGYTPKNGLSDAVDPVGFSSATADYRVVRTDGAKSLHYLLPCRRRVYGHAERVAAARFCIHLNPL